MDRETDARRPRHRLLPLAQRSADPTQGGDEGTAGCESVWDDRPAKGASHQPHHHRSLPAPSRRTRRSVPGRAATRSPAAVPAGVPGVRPRRERRSRCATIRASGLACLPGGGSPRQALRRPGGNADRSGTTRKDSSWGSSVHNRKCRRIPAMSRGSRSASVTSSRAHTCCVSEAKCHAAPGPRQWSRAASRLRGSGRLTISAIATSRVRVQPRVPPACRDRGRVPGMRW